MAKTGRRTEIWYLHYTCAKRCFYKEILKHATNGMFVLRCRYITLLLQPDNRSYQALKFSFSQLKQMSKTVAMLNMLQRNT